MNAAFLTQVLLERSGSGSASERLGLEHALVAGQADMNQVRLISDL